MEYSALCRTDCILLRINQEVFHKLHRKKMEQQKLTLAQFLTNRIPQFLRNYTFHRITDLAYDVFSL